MDELKFYAKQSDELESLLSTLKRFIENKQIYLSLILVRKNVREPYLRRTH